MRQRGGGIWCRADVLIRSSERQDGEQMWCWAEGVKGILRELPAGQSRDCWKGNVGDGENSGVQFKGGAALQLRSVSLGMELLALCEGVKSSSG